MSDDPGTQVVLSINAVKEIYDDYFRHRSDAVVNSSTVEVILSDQPSQTTKWRDLSVGDVVRVRGNTEFPADLVMVQSADPQGLCYVETANLDGETNLKVKSAAPVGLESGAAIAGWDANVLEAKLGGTRIECEAPNNQLYKFEGKWVGITPPPTAGGGNGAGDGGDGGDDLGLSVDNMLLRGSTLRNTDWVLGVVVFTGADSKLMRNMTRSPHKVSQLERHMNLLVVSIGIFQSFCGILLAVLQEEWFKAENTAALKHWYLLPTYEWPDVEGGSGAAATQFVRYVVLLNALIPISLYVTLELVKVIQCGWISLDRRMWDPTYGVRCGVRTTTLNEELGQVQCVLSDKTGTLTQNVMAFVKCSVGGVVYRGDAVPRGSFDLNVDDGVDTSALSPGGGKSGGGKGGPGGAASVHTLANSSALRAAALASDPGVTSFLSHLATCHTVVPAEASPDTEETEFGGLLYQASSPDEEALVMGAALMGRRLASNANNAIVVEVHPADGRTASSKTGTGAAPTETVEILAVNEFSSARKRMSTVVRDPKTGQLKLLLKGADATVLSRLHPEHDKKALNTVQAHLDMFASDGLRTLVLAEKILSAEEYETWNAEYHEASCALTEREEKLAAVAELIERDCQLVGATAVEDKLQDGVPDTIATLRAAGMLVWMLTGDKLETAVSIANTCRLIDADGDLVVLQESDFGPGKDPNFLQAKAREADEDRKAGGEFGLVIEGGALQYALLEEQQEHFLALCRACSGVVCCRVSPIQKARVTGLMKDKGGMITLGVGDGANDVGMIKAAHIGIGISGREGRAAVLASDFSIGQFRFLSRLLLVHGRWSAKRNREVVLYAFYKNFVYTMANVWFGLVSVYSAQPIYTTAAIASFNVLWTSFPTIAFACFDQDVTPGTVMRNPELYRETAVTGGREFLISAAWWLSSALWHSLWCFFATSAALGNGAATTSSGQPWDVWAVGVAAFTCVVITCNAKVMLRTNHWTVLNLVTIAGSVVMWFPFLAILGSLWNSFEIFGTVAFIHQQLLPEPRFWLAVILSVGGSCCADFFVETLHRQVKPSDYEILQEAESIARRKNGGGKGGGGGGKGGGGVGRDGNDADALPLHTVVAGGAIMAAAAAAAEEQHSGGTPLKNKGDRGSLHSLHGGDSTGGNVRPARRKSRNPSVMEVVAKNRAESEDWYP